MLWNYSRWTVLWRFKKSIVVTLVVYSWKTFMEQNFSAAVLNQSERLTRWGTVTLWSSPPFGYKVLQRCVEALPSPPGAWLMRASRSPRGLASLDLYTLSASSPALINKGYISVCLYTMRTASTRLHTTWNISLPLWRKETLFCGFQQSGWSSFSLCVCYFSKTALFFKMLCTYISNVCTNASSYTI